MAITKEQVVMTLQTLHAIADTIRAAKRIPSGHLYAVVMSHMDLATYDRIVQVLKNCGLVKELNHELIWVEPSTN